MHKSPHSAHAPSRRTALLAAAALLAGGGTSLALAGTGTAATATTPATTHRQAQPRATGAGLADPHKKEMAMELASSAENSTLDWKSQYKYIEDIGDGRGYTAGIIGFCSGTGDMLELVEHYTDMEPGNALAKYLPALEAVNGSDSHAGLGSAFVSGPSGTSATAAPA